jgi:murein DD-endopeptidase MepM/ murein hydrolase activator NlpD
VASRGIWPWVLTVAAGVGAGLLLFGLTDDEDNGSAPPAAQQASSEAVEARPSAFAREALAPATLRLYVQTGRELGLDWSVLAAVDQIEGSIGPAQEAERVSAIGYSLQALGAPDDYRLALEARGGAPGYEQQVLRLADRYRAVGGAKPSPASGPLRLPVKGPIIAGYGQRLGVLHDGIDIDARTGTPIRSPAPGLVLSTGTHSIFGQYSCVLHEFEPPLLRNRRITTCYGNQSRYAVAPGDTVEAGDTIGYVGCTGTCLRPHVHFQVRLGSGQTAPVTDPDPFLASAPREIGPGRPLETQAP